MRTLLLTTAFVVAAMPAHAISRYNIQGDSCETVQRILKREGAAILSYPSSKTPGNLLYDRYVTDSRYCEFGEHAVPASVPTTDKKRCLVFKCRDVDYDDARGIWRD